MTDAATARYIHSMQRPFEDLRQAASQLAGWLVLSAAGSNSAVPDHPAIAAARQLHAEARDAILSANATDQAAPHHHHLLRAAEHLDAALRALQKPTLDIDAILAPVRAAYSELELAARALPGFELIQFAQGCCAHAGRHT